MFNDINDDIFLYDIVITAIAKNEGHYLEEWVEYYLSIGVDHFYIYDNDSTDNSKEVLQPYIDKGIVDFIPYNGEEKQLPSLYNSFHNYRYIAKYMINVDIDEFIYIKGNLTIKEFLKNFIEDHNKFELTAALGLNWIIWGTNGQEKADYSKGVIDRCLARDNKFVRVAKYIFNPRRTEGLWKDTHTPIFFADYRDYRFYQARDIVSPNSLIYLNHYRAKSKEEFELKISKGDALKNGRRGRAGGEIFEATDKNFVYDESCLKYKYHMKQRGYIIKTINYDKIERNVLQLIEDMEEEFKTHSSLEKIPYDEYITRLLTYRGILKYLKQKNILKTNFEEQEERILNLLYRILKINNLRLVNTNSLLMEDLPELFCTNCPVIEKLKELYIESNKLLV